MYEFTTDCYLLMAERLVESIGDKRYFSGVITLYDNDVELHLSCSLFVRYAKGHDEEHPFKAISHITPVWWELQSRIGQTIIENDFSFGQMLNLMF